MPVRGSSLLIFQEKHLILWKCSSCCLINNTVSSQQFTWLTGMDGNNEWNEHLLQLTNQIVAKKKYSSKQTKKWLNKESTYLTKVCRLRVARNIGAFRQHCDFLKALIFLFFQVSLHSVALYIHMYKVGSLISILFSHLFRYFTFPGFPLFIETNILHWILF